MSSWAPHAFQRDGEARGYESAYLAVLISEGNRLHSRSLPVVFTLGHLAVICGVRYALLERIVRRQIDGYRVFNIRKRQGGYRQISVPDEDLLLVQRWIHQNILAFQKTDVAATAYSRGCNAKNNASRHVGARWLVKLDITDFFESISERQVFHTFSEIGYGALMAFHLTRLCTRVSERSLKYRKRRWKTRAFGRYRIFANNLLGHLPQGAPTSPMLANLVCIRMDEKMHCLADQFDCAYSRYADDIVFSASTMTRTNAAELIRLASAIAGSFGFTRNRQKTHVATPGSRRIVTGLLVDGLEPRLTPEFKETICIHLYYARKKGIHAHCTWRGFRSLLGFKAHLDGLIKYAEHIEPVFGLVCRKSFTTLKWGELANL
jgi:RNA-directed DNA polymerase